MKKIFFALSIISLITIQCKHKEKSSNISTREELVLTGNPSVSKNFNVEIKGYTTGVIEDKTGLDGCTFLIKVNDSTTYEPVNLPEAFKKGATKVYFKYALSRAPSICMVGQTVSIKEINLLK
jgi:hypothetical protein